MTAVDAAARRPARSSLPILLLAALLFVVFCALGTWQVQRRAWKLDLIEQVENQLARDAIDAPGPARWQEIGPQHNYLPVQAQGVLLHERQTLVGALTTHGSGYWVMTPMLTTRGFFVLVNRGFVDPAHRDPASRGETVGDTRVVTVRGLLRTTEPEGRLWQENDPAADRWYSRDVAAISAHRELPPQGTAPYFIDADATPNPDGWPVGGLTVVKFRNAHLGYAITWYALAALTLVGAWLALRHRDDPEPTENQS